MRPENTDVLDLTDDVFDAQMALCMLNNSATSGDKTASNIDITHSLITYPTDVILTCKVSYRSEVTLQAEISEKSAKSGLYIYAVVVSVYICKNSVYLH